VTDTGGIVVFDGTCVLCNGGTRFIVRHDKQGRIRYAAAQTERGRAILRDNGADPDDPRTFVLLADGRAYKESDAVIRVLTLLGGLWRAAAVLRVIPKAWRDALYRLIARNRYNWFGRRSLCLVSEPAAAERFLT
jgi:predicted DCC family thiol-disulfide oxidoreductase YuxK